MHIERIPIADKGAFLTCYIQDYSREMPLWTQRPAVMICPGGGYEMVSDREGEPIALRFLAEGFHAFVLTYSVVPNATFPQPLVELSLAMAAVRARAEAWHLNADQIAVAGFSAGGHLASTLGTLWNHEILKTIVPEGQNKPNALILGYPVISIGPNAHQASILNVCGGRTDLGDLLSTDKNVGTHTPPTFIFHTADDTVVPVQNALLFANALTAHHIPYELHIYPHGIHGISLADAQTCNGWQNCVNPTVATWQTLCVTWLRGLFAPPEGQ